MKKALGRIWFSARWITGAAVDVGITVGSIVGSSLALEKLINFNPLKALGIPVSWMENPLVSFCIAMALFGAGLAGRQWVRTQYFTHLLPEVWDDTIQNLLKRAHEEHKDE